MRARCSMLSKIDPVLMDLTEEEKNESNDRSAYSSLGRRAPRPAAAARAVRRVDVQGQNRLNLLSWLTPASLKKQAESQQSLD